MASYPVINDNEPNLIKKIAQNTAEMAAGGGGGVTVQDQGTDLGRATIFNFTGAGVNASVAGANVIEVNVPGGGGGSYPEVANFAALPAAATHNGEIYVARGGQGVIFINRQPAGLYYSDGASWTWLSDLPSIYFTGYMQGANNLSDVATPATAFANIKQAATTAATGVVELATDGENAANVVVQGNDSRLSNARTPSAHKTSHENGGADEISVAGLSGELADAQPPKVHAASHATGQADAISPASIGAAAAASFIAGAGALTGPAAPLTIGTAAASAVGDFATAAQGTDARTPTAHAASHASGQSDAIKIDDLAAGDDNTDLDSSTTAHGLALKVTAPASGMRNVHCVDNAETARKDAALFVAGNPAALGTAAAGTALTAARSDHVHTLPKPTELAADTFKETVWISADAMRIRTTGGAPAGAAEMATYKEMLASLDFDAAADEFAQFIIAMPKSWNEGTVTAQFIWAHPATTTNFDVVWGLQGIAVGNDDALDVAFGTAQTVTDTGGTTDDVYVSGETAAITIGGTPAENDVVWFQVYRDADAGADTMAVDARLIGVKLFITTNALTDA